MKYLSTRDATLRFDAAQAIVQGLSRDGGLFMPEAFPVMPAGMLEELIRADYQTRAVRIMKLFLEDFSEEELAYFASKAYAFGEKFDTEAVAPVHHVTEGTEVLELWHGPTCAFKDMALQMLPWLLTASLRKNGEERTVSILVATKRVTTGGISSTSSTSTSTRDNTVLGRLTSGSPCFFRIKSYHFL